MSRDTPPPDHFRSGFDSYLRTMHAPLTTLSDDEALFREAVAGFANEEVRPRVREMEREGKIDPDLMWETTDKRDALRRAVARTATVVAPATLKRAAALVNGRPGQTGNARPQVSA